MNKYQKEILKVQRYVELEFALLDRKIRALTGEDNSDVYEAYMDQARNSLKQALDVARDHYKDEIEEAVS